VAALLLVAASVIGIQYSRLGQAPQPAAGPDDPPQAVELFYARDPFAQHALVAYDWAGSRRGSIKLPTWVDVSRLRMASDGSGFLLDPAFPGDYAAYFDRLGSTLDEIDDPAFSSQVWAADNRHTCVLSMTDGGLTLTTRLPGNPDQDAHVGLPGDLVEGQATLAACSPKSDTAVLEVQFGDPSGTTGGRVVRLKLSTGAVLGQGELAGLPVVSLDGAYLAIGSNGGALPSTRVYRATDLATPVAELAPTVVPAAFSGDGSLLLAGTASGGAIEVLDWRSGRVIWHFNVSVPYGPWVVRSSGGDFAIAIGGNGAQSIVVAHRDGKTTTITLRDLIGS
jgi:hypothetical protein